MLRFLRLLQRSDGDNGHSFWESSFLALLKFLEDIGSVFLPLILIV